VTSLLRDAAERKDNSSLGLRESGLQIISGRILKQAVTHRQEMA
jgi:hypothetical protein